MIKKLMLSALFFALCASASVAQQTVTDDYHKFEVFGGYSNNQVDTGLSDDDNDLRDFFDDRSTFNGFEASAVGNFSRYVGAKGSISGHYNKDNFSVPRILTPNVSDQFRVKNSLYNFLGGVQVKDNATEGSRVRPFGHAMVGVARAKSEIDNSFFSTQFCQQPGVDCRNEIGETDYGFSAAIGGGLDVKATERFSIRAFQVDYNPTRINDSTQNNFRFGFGVVFH